MLELAANNNDPGRMALLPGPWHRIKVYTRYVKSSLRTKKNVHSWQRGRALTTPRSWIPKVYNNV